MTGTWETLTPRQQDAARQAFAALGALDRLDQAGRERSAGARRVGFSDLYAFATEPERAMTPALARALGADARLRDDLERLLVKTARYRSPRLAAASSGPVVHRQGTGFTIDLRPSRAEASQVYVIIELDDIVPGLPRILFVTGRRDRLLKHPLPAAQGNTIQLLAEADSDLIQALRDPGSEVFLR